MKTKGQGHVHQKESSGHERTITKHTAAGDTTIRAALDWSVNQHCNKVMKGSTRFYPFLRVYCQLMLLGKKSSCPCSSKLLPSMVMKAILIKHSGSHTKVGEEESEEKKGFSRRGRRWETRTEKITEIHCRWRKLSRTEIEKKPISVLPQTMTT